jgi:adenylate cyclase
MSPRNRITLAGLAALAVVLGLFALKPGVLVRTEQMLLDWRFLMRGPRAPAVPIVIAAIDAKSVDQLGRWPWRRTVMADLILKLNEAGAAAIGLDIVFSEPEEPPEMAPLRDARHEMERLSGDITPALALVDEALERASTDDHLEAAIREASRNLTMGFFFRTEKDAALDGGTVSRLEETLPLVRKSKLKLEARVADKELAPFLTCADVEPNIERFHLLPRRMGFFSTDTDIDGVVRSSSLLLRCQDALYVSLDLAIAEVALQQNAEAIGFPEQGTNRTPGVSEIRLGDLVIPTDPGGRILVNYRGPTRTFPHFSIVDVLAGEHDAEIEGAIVIVGPTEVGIQDVYGSPYAKAFPGVEVHATVVDNILSGQVLRQNTEFAYIELAIIVLSALLIIFLAPRLGGAAAGAVFSLTLLAGIVVLITWLFVDRNWWVNLSYPSLSVVATYLSVAVTQSMTVEAKSRQIRKQFETYVSPDVVDQMTASPDAFQLGGERRDLSILFSDIRSFTTISEDIGAEAVVRMLQAYLTPMTDIVFRSQGTLDKYIGDAVMAFWGAPLPVADHPLAAAEAALEMQSEVARLRETLAGEVPGMERLKIGIGIHSAEVSVGNMGSVLRVDYTVIGDGVNLCARIESLTKKYGAGVLASGALIERLPEGFLFRELDEIKVKGKTTGVRLFELIGRRDATPDEKGWLEAYASGLPAYKAGRWDEAEAAFRKCLELRGGQDLACEMMLERIERLRRDPPDSWDGIYAFEEK